MYIGEIGRGRGQAFPRDRNHGTLPCALPYDLSVDVDPHTVMVDEAATAGRTHAKEKKNSSAGRLT